jgi:hypothetical protein
MMQNGFARQKSGLCFAYLSSTTDNFAAFSSVKEWPIFCLGHIAERPTEGTMTNLIRVNFADLGRSLIGTPLQPLMCILVPGFLDNRRSVFSALQELTRASAKLTLRTVRQQQLHPSDHILNFDESSLVSRYDR